VGNDSPFLRAPLLSPTSSLLTGRRLDFHQLADYHASRTTPGAAALGAETQVHLNAVVRCENVRINESSR